MSLKKIYPLILCGGTGSRLWPLSNANYPKQFLEFEDKALLVNTMIRVKKKHFHPPVIVGNFQHRFIIKNKLDKENIKYNSILLEPIQRNTMASILLGSLMIKDLDPNALVLVLPSDHLIKKDKKFNEILLSFLKLDELDDIITFGIKPTSPSSDYGYIKKSNSKKSNSFVIKEFIEKPKPLIAKKLIKEGNWFWNSGMFLFNIKTLFREANIISSKNIEVLNKVYDKKSKDAFFYFFKSEIFKLIEGISFDNAIMEKTKKALVKPVDLSWSDIGTWNSFLKNKKLDKNKNIKVGENIFAENCSDSIIFKSDNNKKVVLLGMDNIVFIEHDDSLLISKKDKITSLKDLLKKKNSQFLNISSKVFRPWGEYKTIYNDHNFLVKILTIYPKSQISLQYHNHRSEHWIITKGVATITKGEKIFELKENQSTYIDKGEIHRIENKKNQVLVIVEVQAGKKISEQDIIRLDDIYGRNVKKK